MTLFGFDCCCCELIKTLFIPGVVAVVTLLAVLRFYCIATCGKFVSNISMKGKTVIVTGANSGIGKETVRELAKRGARVIMACRNLVLANNARDELLNLQSDAILVVKQLDLSSEDSIRAFADDIVKTESKLDVLVHNAGIALSFRGENNDAGIELTMATNHYGPIILTHLLIDLLKKSKPSRIVIVASDLYKLASVNLNKMNPIGSFPAAYLYYVSKYANIYFSNELARRLEGSGVTVNCLHPGLIDTGIWRNVPFPVNYGLQLILKGFCKTPEQGAQTTIYAACSDELNGVTGKYFIDCKEAELNRAASDMDKAKKVWEESLKIIKLKPTDPKI